MFSKGTYPGGPAQLRRKKRVKEGTSGNERPPEAAAGSDEPVVVMSLVPMNAGDGWEGKTQATLTML